MNQTHHDNSGKLTTTSPADSISTQQNGQSKDETSGAFAHRNLSLKDMMRLQRTVGNQAALRLVQNAERTNKPTGEGDIQRVFAPMRVSSKSHMRNRLQGVIDADNFSGRAIPSDTEVVADPANQVVQVRKWLPDVTWTKAVDVNAANWQPGIHPLAATYIRNSKLVAIPYPKQAVTVAIGDRGDHQLQPDWHEDIGEYYVFEKSIETPGDDIIKRGENYYRMTAGHQIFALSNREKSQIDRVGYVRNRLVQILRTAAVTGGIDPALIASDENVKKLLTPLRISLSNHDAVQRNRWFTWAQNVFAKITTGATEVINSLLHWRSQIYPPDVTAVGITKVDIEGSDLHDHGLGAMFVTYTKPNDANGMFPNVPSVKVVIKPEDRNIEKSLFGNQAGSLANVVNVLAGLAPEDAISTIKMETHAQYGSLIEFVQGQQARALSGAEPDSQAMSEAMAFTFLTGMSDVHQDNVIWRGGKPYFIDADNSLNAGRLNQVSNQSGFSKYNQATQGTDVNAYNNDPASSRSEIIQAIIANSTPFIDAIRAAFNNKEGRVVPLFTNFWANRWKGLNYISQPEGTPPDDIQVVASRYSIVNHAVGKLPRGNNGVGDMIGTGLAGEAGISGAGEAFDVGVATQQTKLDLDQGKIPFFTYDYTTGLVSQNGQPIWRGQSLDDAMNILLAKFPAPLGP